MCLPLRDEITNGDDGALHLLGKRLDLRAERSE
jgi:hypothetical protein